MTPWVIPWSTEVLPGVVLSRTAAGSQLVHLRGRCVGYLHASGGCHWHANLLLPGGSAQYVGRFPGYTAVHAIAAAAAGRVQELAA